MGSDQAVTLATFTSFSLRFTAVQSPIAFFTCSDAVVVRLQVTGITAGVRATPKDRSTAMHEELFRLHQTWPHGTWQSVTTMTSPCDVELTWMSVLLPPSRAVMAASSPGDVSSCIRAAGWPSLPALERAPRRGDAGSLLLLLCVTCMQTRQCHCQACLAMPACNCKHLMIDFTTTHRNRMHQATQSS